MNKIEVGEAGRKPDLRTRKKGINFIRKGWGPACAGLHPELYNTNGTPTKQ